METLGTDRKNLPGIHQETQKYFYNWTGRTVQQTQNRQPDNIFGKLSQNTRESKIHFEHTTCTPRNVQVDWSNYCKEAGKCIEIGERVGGNDKVSTITNDWKRNQEMTTNAFVWKFTGNFHHKIKKLSMSNIIIFLSSQFNNQFVFWVLELIKLIGS